MLFRSAMWARIGRVGAVLYLLAIAATAVAAGWLLDACFPSMLAAVPMLDERCAACASSAWSIASAIVLLGLLAPGLLPERPTLDAEF